MERYFVLIANCLGRGDRHFPLWIFPETYNGDNTETYKQVINARNEDLTILPVAQGSWHSSPLKDAFPEFFLDL